MIEWRQDEDMAQSECKTGKIQHRSEKSALKKGRKFKRSGDRVRAYLCGLCGFWHVTCEDKGGDRYHDIKTPYKRQKIDWRKSDPF